jgi:ABC-type Fe3+/spermidine/putrescine transport system ATPase subunit
MRLPEIRERVKPVSELLRLDEFLDRKPAQLSGGQQQSCAMVRTLVKDADLVMSLLLVRTPQPTTTNNHNDFNLLRV